MGRICRSRMGARQPSVSARQEENRLLAVRGEEQEVHDLGDAGAGDVGQGRQTRTVSILSPIWFR